jgi:hypothetical protein
MSRWLIADIVEFISICLVSGPSSSGRKETPTLSFEGETSTSEEGALGKGTRKRREVVRG